MNFRLINHKTRRLSAKYLTDVYDLSNGDNEYTYCCVPNGEFGITIVLEGHCHIKTEEGWQKQAKTHLYGLINKVQLLKMSPNYREISLGFYPHYLQLFLNDSLQSINKTNGTDLCDLLKKEKVNKLYENLCQCENDEVLMDKIEEFLKDKKDLYQIIHYDSDKRKQSKKLFIEKITPYLSPNAVFIVDDIQDNLAFKEYVLSHKLNYRIFQYESKFLGAIFYADL